MPSLGPGASQPKHRVPGHPSLEVVEGEGPPVFKETHSSHHKQGEETVLKLGTGPVFALQKNSVANPVPETWTIHGLYNGAKCYP